MKKPTWWTIVIIGVAVLLISRIDFVRYKYVSTSGTVYKVDRFTGETYVVGPGGIRKVRDR